MKKTFLAALAVTLLLAPTLSAQGVIVDEGTFAVRIGGAEVGTESFVIRRPGVGRDDAVFANGVIQLRRPAGAQEVRSLLRATPDGVADRYQVTITGAGAMEIRVASNANGRRYSASIRSEAGSEDREFQGHPDTRILEFQIAHHYYFLRNAREGRAVHGLVPRSRLQIRVTPGETVEETLRLGVNTVQARHVAFTSDDGTTHDVWFDRQGRVLKVEIPSLDYAAERTDLVG